MNPIITFRQGDILQFNYKNHRDEDSTRIVRFTVRFEGLDYGRNDWYPTPGWFMRAWVLERQQARSLRFENMTTPPVLLQEGPENINRKSDAYWAMFNRLYGIGAPIYATNKPADNALLDAVENPDAFFIRPGTIPITWYAGVGLNPDGSITTYTKDQLNKPKERFGEDMDD